MSDVLIRTCLQTEIYRVQQLVNDLYSHYSGRKGVIPDVLLPFAEFERHPDKGRIVVFDQNQEIIGYAILVFFFSNEFCGDILEIDELVVDSQHRGSGVATKFFSWLAQEYPAAAALSLQVSPENISAERLYARNGFKPSGNKHLLKQL
jgi:GNAT superfamily N-acetyltransferase